MLRKILGTSAFLTFVLAVMVSPALRAPAQDAKTTYPAMVSLDQYLMERSAEIALARSAAPDSISHDAEVMVLGRHGYETAAKGTNGFVCLVWRSWAAGIDDPDFWDPKPRGPVCLNAPAARFNVPLTQKRTELALAGRSQSQMFADISAAFEKKEFPPLEPGVMCYMLSKQGYLNGANASPPITSHLFSSPFPQATQIRLQTSAQFPVHCADRASISVNACRIAVGSTRRPKLQAVQEATASFAAKLSPNAPLEIHGHEVESGVSHTPSSREELMQGARQRAEALHKMLADSGDRADFCVGLEGGLDVAVENGVRRVFLESWAYVTDGARGHFGCSGSIEIPELLAEEVLARGTELSVAIDRYAGAVGVRDGQGAWGVLSDNLVSRAESFRLAVVVAFAPFYNERMYRGVAQAAG